MCRSCEVPQGGGDPLLGSCWLLSLQISGFSEEVWDRGETDRMSERLVFFFLFSLPFIVIFKYLFSVFSLSMFDSHPPARPHPPRTLPPLLILLFSPSPPPFLPRRLQKAKVSITCSLPAGHVFSFFVLFFYGIREAALKRLILRPHQTGRPPAWDMTICGRWFGYF